MNDVIEEPDNIIQLRPGADAALEIQLKSKEASKCYRQHKNITVDAETRSVVCTHCGFVVDPFDYLLEWAREGERRMDGLKGIEHKRRVMQAEHDDLQRMIVNLRAQLKRAGHPQTAESKRAYDMQRWNPPQSK